MPPTTRQQAQADGPEPSPTPALTPAPALIQKNSGRGKHTVQAMAPPVLPGLGQLAPSKHATPTAVNVTSAQSLNGLPASAVTPMSALAPPKSKKKKNHGSKCSALANVPPKITGKEEPC
ncbi:unnamed protein product [Peniophora sp. CBMAI 1063]|nr:unnamed protein product [Peniophora sp. CBMAI 1063]